jgi:glycerophosphoryl diester phosphodiesterase
MAIAVAVWLGVRALVNAAAVAAGTGLVGRVASASDSLRVLLAATGGWAVVSLVLDAAVAFLGIAWVSTVLAKLYHEDTELHAQTALPDLSEIPGRLAAGVRRWTRPARLVPLLVGALVVSTVAGAVLLERVPDPRPVAVTAHRAGPPPAPENTLAALEAAVEAGADWSEVDVQLTRDSVPVLVHDVDLLRVAGDRRRVSQVDHEEIRGLVAKGDAGVPADERRIVTLPEFLDRAQRRIGVAVELKYYGRNPELARRVAEVLAEREADDRVMVMSLELGGVRQFRDLAPGVPAGWAAAAAVGAPARLDVDFLALSRSAASPSQIRAAHGAGMDVHVWTLNRADLMAEAIQRGADGIITDRPGLAVEVREELADLPAISRLLLRFGHLLTEEPDGTPAEDEL